MKMRNQGKNISIILKDVEYQKKIEYQNAIICMIAEYTGEKVNVLKRVNDSPVLFLNVIASSKTLRKIKEDTNLTDMCEMMLIVDVVN